MFKKLLSNLPYNPSLIGQVSFYAKRLHNEATLRRMGFAMIILAMLLQSFAVFSPPEASLQASPNTDLINGGFNSKSEAVRHCKNDTQDFKQIVAYFGISCDDIANASTTHIAPKDHSGDLYSMGRLSFGVDGEKSVRIPDVGKFYVRHFWSLNKKSSYEALKVKNSAGKTFYILYDCGNLVSIGVPAPPPPKDVCTNISGLQTDPEDCDVCPGINGIQLNKSQCDVCPNTPGTQTSRTKCDVCPNTPGTQTSTTQCDICPQIAGVQTNKNQCKSCAESQTQNDLTACLDYSKKARNVTQGIANANGKTAKPGDIIEYRLTTKNSGKIDIKGYQVTEEIGDVLDYADVTDLHGGTLGDYQVITWPKVDIKAGQSVVNLITIKVKDPLPNTPVSSSDPKHFDMVMTNVYGDTVNIKLPPSVTKTVEIATTTLPNTGPGTSLAMGFGLTVFIAYFFARSRLLARELDVVRTDFASAGGY